MTVLAEALAEAIALKEGRMRCVDCQHKQSIHIVSETGKKQVRCRGNNEKCKCSTPPQPAIPQA